MPHASLLNPLHWTHCATPQQVHQAPPMQLVQTWVRGDHGEQHHGGASTSRQGPALNRCGQHHLRISTSHDRAQQFFDEARIEPVPFRPLACSAAIPICAGAGTPWRRTPIVVGHQCRAPECDLAPPLVFCPPVRQRPFSAARRARRPRRDTRRRCGRDSQPWRPTGLGGTPYLSTVGLNTGTDWLHGKQRLLTGTVPAKWTRPCLTDSNRAQACVACQYS